MSTTLGFLGNCDLFPCLEGGSEGGIGKVKEREKERGGEGREKTLAISDNLIN